MNEAMVLLHHAETNQIYMLKFSMMVSWGMASLLEGKSLPVCIQCSFVGSYH